MARLGTNPAQLQSDQTALQKEQTVVKHTYANAGPPPRSIERSLAAVRDPSGGNGGWLLVLRDVTEEQALAVLREDLTHMLIHDLRSPLGSILTSLSLIQQVAQPGQPLERDYLLKSRQETLLLILGGE
jgi:signal transduction histidine kinase